MLGRLLAVWYLCEAPNPHAVGIICVANCGVSSTLRGKKLTDKKLLLK